MLLLYSDLQHADQMSLEALKKSDNTLKVLIINSRALRALDLIINSFWVLSYT